MYLHAVPRHLGGRQTTALYTLDRARPMGGDW